MIDGDADSEFWDEATDLLAWLRETTEKTIAATADFENLMWCKKQLEKLELELERK